jgi:hypothetical protein
MDIDHGHVSVLLLPLFLLLIWFEVVHLLCICLCCVTVNNSGLNHMFPVTLYTLSGTIPL